MGKYELLWTFLLHLSLLQNSALFLETLMLFNAMSSHVAKNNAYYDC